MKYLILLLLLLSTTIKSETFLITLSDKHYKNSVLIKDISNPNVTDPNTNFNNLDEAFSSDLPNGVHFINGKAYYLIKNHGDTNWLLITHRKPYYSDNNFWNYGYSHINKDNILSENFAISNNELNNIFSDREFFYAMYTLVAPNSYIPFIYDNTMNIDQRNIDMYSFNGSSFEYLKKVNMYRHPNYSWGSCITTNVHSDPLYINGLQICNVSGEGNLSIRGLFPQHSGNSNDTYIWVGKSIY